MTIRKSESLVATDLFKMTDSGDESIIVTFHAKETPSSDSSEKELDDVVSVSLIKRWICLQVDHRDCAQILKFSGRIQIEEVIAKILGNVLQSEVAL